MVRKEVNVMATAVSGCNIREADESNGKIKYERKCDHCGWTPSNYVSTTFHSGKNQYGGFTCPKCHQHNNIVIMG